MVTVIGQFKQSIFVLLCVMLCTFIFKSYLHIYLSMQKHDNFLYSSDIIIIL